MTCMEVNIMFNSIFKNEINTFLFSLNNYEKSTLRHYKEALHSFDEWLNENNLEGKFILSGIGDGWVKKISITNSKSTVYKKILIINKFLKFLCTSVLTSHDFTTLLKI